MSETIFLGHTMSVRRAFALLAIGIAASAFVPYNFALTEDQVLMKVFQYRNPTLYPHDLLMESVAVYGPYNAFARILSSIPSEFLPLAMYAGWLTSWVLVALATCWGLENVLGAAYPLTATAVFLVALGLSYRWQHFGGFILGDNDLFYPFLRNQTWAWCATTWGFWVHLKGRPIQVGLSLAIASILHVNTGQHFALLLLADTLAFGCWKSLVKSTLVAAVASGPLLWPMIWSEFLSGDTTTSGSFVAISAYFRHPHHLVFSSWPLVLYFQYFVFLGIGILCWWCKRPKLRTDFRLIGVVLSANAFMVLGYAFVELWATDIAAKLQLARMALFVKVILLAYMANSCSTLCACPLNRIASAFPESTSRWSMILLVVGLAVIPLRHTVLPPKLTGLERFFRNDTPVSSTILLPPSQLFPSFGSRAERGMLVNGTLMPFTKPYYEMYYRRLLDSAGAKCDLNMDAVRLQQWTELLRRFHAQDSEEFIELSMRNHFDYLVRIIALEDVRLDWSIVYEDSQYRVYGKPFRNAN